MPRSTKTRLEVYAVDKCRICESKKINRVITLGRMPLVNSLISPDNATVAEKHYPLDINHCSVCGQVQTAQLIDPEVNYKHYLYVPTSSKTMLKNLKEHAKEALAMSGAKKGDYVLELGSNLGDLLQCYSKKGVKVLGVDPAENLAKIANAQGMETIADFFSKALAKKIKSKYGKFKAISATNVWAHIPDIHDAAEGIKILLEKDGVFVIEVPYLIDTLNKIDIGQFYHEHLSYFSVTALQNLFDKHDLVVSHVKRLPNIHDGSIRVFVKHKGAQISEDTKQILKDEAAYNLQDASVLIDFAQEVDRNGFELVSLLRTFKKAGISVAGYGASAKFNILTNLFRIGPELLPYVVDSISFKHGKLTPGMNIPIYPEKHLVKDMPNFALLGAWNFADEIIAKNKVYRKKGGRFISPIPRLKFY